MTEIQVLRHFSLGESNVVSRMFYSMTEIQVLRR